MNVKELIALLEKMDPEANVYIDRFKYSEELFHVEEFQGNVFLLDKESYLDRL